VCGFACVYARRPEGAASEELLRAMGRALAHRGPDEDRVVVRGRMGMAHRRLTIIDLTGGHQPMASADGTQWIVFNGEIYNFREVADELRREGVTVSGRSDTEVLLAAYRRWGEACLDRLNGMFAFVIYDEAADRVFAARDRFGEKPLYVAETADRILFASELKAFTEGGVVPGAVDPTALLTYFTLGYVTGPRTIFSGVRRLAPGHALRVADGRVEEWGYWAPPAPTNEITDPAEASARCFELLRDSVRMRLVSDVPIGFFLSGGIDSSAVVALAAETAGSRIETFSVGFEDPRYDERPYARRVAAQFGTQHHEFVLKPEGIDVVEKLAWHLDEPFADPSALPTYFLSQLTRDRVKVALSGDGGDEIFAGYDVYRGHLLSERARRLGPGLPLAVGALSALSAVSPSARERFERLLRNLRDARLTAADRFLAKQQTVFRAGFLNAAARDGAFAGAGAGESERVGEIFAAAPSPLHAIAAWQMAVSLPDDMLVKVDRMSMAHSLETRAPFLDHRLAETMARVSFDARMPGGRTKYLLKHALETAGIFDHEFLWRRKQGFVVPLSFWFREDLAGYARDRILAPKALVGEIFRREALERVLSEQASGRRNWGPAVWGLLMFEEWGRRYRLTRGNLPGRS
jgi:asparagine synthase (glutamine-hydrolysing)